ncbi:MAR-binding protein [Tieghemostelium lacteum]|uniref:MAR-binding protein n=1 Tax=Tieghemostelium lacteum TaxID=361077 RepID=A0A151Z801_TIELA|nr:MAR-binding protein [Tieghemostelium lacteum]|eukprot:KYQ90082.1 MAR-binding protein [Tieghemostelium lacteum]
MSPNSVFFAMEGSGPLANICRKRENIQRQDNTKKPPKTKERDFIKLLNKEIELKPAIKSLVDSVPNYGNLTRSSFLPGDKLMGILKEKLMLLSQILTTDKIVEKVTVSGPETMGESIWKIHQHILHQHYHPTDEISIFSTDSKAILFSLLCQRNIHLFRSYFNNFIFIDICSLRSKLQYSLPQRHPEQVILDFVFMILLAGSEYLPKISNSFVLERDFEIYKQNTLQHGFYNPNDRTINIGFIISMIPTQKVNFAPPENQLKKAMKNLIYYCSKSTGRTEHNKFKFLPGSLMINDVVVNLDTNKPEVENLKSHLSLSSELWSQYPLNEEQKSNFNNQVKYHLKRIILETKEKSAEQFNSYYQGLVWQMEYLQVASDKPDFSYIYPYKEGLIFNGTNSGMIHNSINTLPSEFQSLKNPIPNTLFSNLLLCNNKDNISLLLQPLYLKVYKSFDPVTVDMVKEYRKEFKQLLSIDKSKLSRYQQSIALTYNPIYEIYGINEKDTTISYTFLDNRKYGPSGNEKSDYKHYNQFFNNFKELIVYPERESITKKYPINHKNMSKEKLDEVSKKKKSKKSKKSKSTENDEMDIDDTKKIKKKSKSKGKEKLEKKEEDTNNSKEKKPKKQSVNKEEADKDVENDRKHKESKIKKSKKSKIEDKEAKKVEGENDDKPSEKKNSKKSKKDNSEPVDEASKESIKKSKSTKDKMEIEVIVVSNKSSKKSNDVEPKKKRSKPDKKRKLEDPVEVSHPKKKVK